MSTLFSLKVGTTTYDPPDRASNRLKLDRLVLSLDEPGTLEFHQYGATLPPLFKEGAAVTLSYSGTPKFKGEIIRVDPQFTEDRGWVIGYQCGDLKYIGNKVYVTNPNDSTGTITFNLPSDDDDYVSTMAGQTVAQILGYMFTQHASALSAIGIAGYNSSDLTGLTVVPPEPIVMQGPFFQSIDSFLDQWAGKYCCVVLYDSGSSSWKIRILDTTSFSASTLTLGSDPIDPPSIARDSSGSYSAVVVRGRSEIEALFESVVDGTLTKAWSGGDESAWTWNDWIAPNGATDYGSISTVGSTTIVVSSHSGSTTWATNFWSTNHAVIWLINNVATGVTQQEMRLVTACTSLSAGGTSTITLDRALVNGGYTSYRLICAPPNSRIDVWRRYNVTSTVAFNKLVHKFFPPVKWVSNGVGMTITYPAGNIVNSDGRTWPAYFTIDSANNQIVFSEPVVKPFNTPDALQSGGSSVIAPSDVQVAIPYSRGTMTARAPSSGYSGTFYSYAGVSRIWYIDAPQWIYKGDQTNYDNYAAMKLDTVKDTVITGSVTYQGLYATALTLGMSLNIAGVNGGGSYTTGWESLAAPVRTVVVNWPESGAVNFATTMAINNRRKQATGDSLYIHPAFTGTAAWEVSQQAGFAGAQFGVPMASGMSEYQGGPMHDFSAPNLPLDGPSMNPLTATNMSMQKRDQPPSDWLAGHNLAGQAPAFDDFMNEPAATPEPPATEGE